MRREGRKVGRGGSRDEIMLTVNFFLKIRIFHDPSIKLHTVTYAKIKIENPFIIEFYRKISVCLGKYTM